ncbi:hypothetical protein FRC01_007727, partial [Tulasnella sp. 417]
MKIKLAVSLVSRAWQNVAVEFLFNSIRISDWKKAPLLRRAIEADARRRGGGASKETIARPGSAAWWIRELWIDFEMMKYFGENVPTEFTLTDLIKMCPNILVFRGRGRLIGSWWMAQDMHMAPVEQVLDLSTGSAGRLPDEGHEVQGSDFDGPDTGRQVELDGAFGWTFGVPSFIDRPPATPRTVTMPCVFSVDLESFYTLIDMNMADYNTFRLPNLVHLTLRGAGSVRCATTSLILPSLRSVTFGVNDRTLPIYGVNPRLPDFLEKHGLGLVEMTVLERSYLGHLRRLDRFCPILRTFRTHYQSLPGSSVPSVRTVGLYGLEHAGRGSESGETVISNIFRAFPEVHTIQDLGWRSGVIRRRAYVSWTDPEGAKRREFWAQILRTVRRGDGSPLLV